MTKLTLDQRGIHDATRYVRDAELASIMHFAAIRENVIYELYDTGKISGEEYDARKRRIDADAKEQAAAVIAACDAARASHGIR